MMGGGRGPRDHGVTSLSGPKGGWGTVMGGGEGVAWEEPLPCGGVTLLKAPKERDSRGRTSGMRYNSPRGSGDNASRDP